MAKKNSISKNVTIAESGLVDDSVWKRSLKGRPVDLICQIRQKLLDENFNLNEKFNCNSRYFGYCIGQDKDKVFIYVQKKDLRIDLCIGRENEDKLTATGFNVKYVNNYQGRSGWLTGWHVPHNTKDTSTMMRWINKAFENTL